MKMGSFTFSGDKMFLHTIMMCSTLKASLLVTSQGHGMTHMLSGFLGT